METKIPTEILTKILNNNTSSTQDLYSSLLVNRISCKVTVPLLWELTLGQECCMDDEELSKKALCIRTYISCMDTQARTLLTQNGFDLSSSPPQATFDYPSLTEVPKNFGKNFRDYSDIIVTIFKLLSAPKIFKKLESLTSIIIRDEQIRSLTESLALISDNILNMDLSLFSHSQARFFAELISTQKCLENLSIIAARYEKSSPIGQFTSLQELNMENCYGLHKSDSLFFASSFTQLSSFHFSYQIEMYHHEFAIKILEVSNANLKNLCLDLYFQQF
ncbi:4256_t:CDS:2 [Diversispora eburnea]|uniref:4256_t:CDS:1 n=1 Tax=Diversispora eburnea TaxID=1213867 RepID=A0A9N9G254_9GLOM|nr:4256_t:CDS:2 [Diversispora eburnea]